MKINNDAIDGITNISTIFLVIAAILGIYGDWSDPAIGKAVCATIIIVIGILVVFLNCGREHTV